MFPLIGVTTVANMGVQLRDSSSCAHHHQPSQAEKQRRTWLRDTCDAKTYGVDLDRREAGALARRGQEPGEVEPIAAPQTAERRTNDGLIPLEQVTALVEGTVESCRARIRPHVRGVPHDTGVVRAIRPARR